MKVHFSSLNGGMVSYDYQYRLASVIYRKLGDKSPELAEREHYRRGSKMYTFSGLIDTQSELKNDGISFQKGYFVLTSPDIDLILNSAESFLDEPEFEIIGDKNTGKFKVEKVEIVKPPNIGSRCTFRTISPVYVKTIRGTENSRREVDLFPTEPKFYERLHLNLVKKFELFYDRKPVDYFDTLGIKNLKPKRVKVGNNYRRCSLFTIILEGSPELLNFAYDAGIGEKGAMGFGCLDIL